MKKLIAISLTIASVLISVPASALDHKEGVYIVPGSEINLVSHSSNIPVQIKNTFDADVVVHLFVRPSNARVLIPSAVEVKIPAETTVTAKIPVNAVADGKVLLRAWITTFSGIKLGNTVVLSLNVNAGIEIAILIGFGLLVVLLFGFGVARTLRKKKPKK